jgi:glyceraldehyde 3-phosphate dehydrogenase
MAIRIGINGFGRIGRLVFRTASERGIEIAAVNDLVPSDNLAYLLTYDTTHRRFTLGGKPADVKVSDDGFTVNGKKTLTLSERDPGALPWKKLGVDYVLESTGLFTDFENASKHVGAGAKRVIISAPTKSGPDQVPTFCLGVNQDSYDPAKHTVVSNASCTTNCLAPIAKVIQDSFGIDEGLMTTVHAVTATQPTQDGPQQEGLARWPERVRQHHPGVHGRREGGHALHPLPQGQAHRHGVPRPHRRRLGGRPDVPHRKATSLKAINAAMKAASAEGPLAGILGYTEDEVVSSDFIGDRRSSIFDAAAGIELNDRFFKVVSWYDNESGYATRCVDLIEFLAKKEKK